MTVWKLNARQLGYVALITRIAVENGLGRKAAVYAVACSGAEASLTNWENDGRSTHVARGGRISGRQLNDVERAMCRRSRGLGDGLPPWGDNLDSMGLFAQRPIEGWGPPEKIMQPEFATKAFLGRLAAVPGWATLPAAELIRHVQGYHSDIYTDWLATAESVIPLSTSSAPTPRKDWFDMATLQDLDNALDKLADKVVDRVIQKLPAVVNEVVAGVLRAGEFQLTDADQDARIHDIVQGVVRDMKANGEFNVTA